MEVKPRPSLLRVAWPGVVCWGAIGVLLVGLVAFHMLDLDSGQLVWGLRVVYTVSFISVILMPAASLVLTAVCREARRPVPLLVNFGVLFPVYFLYLWFSQTSHSM